MKRHLAATLFLANCVLVIGCVVEPANRANRNASNANVSALPRATATMSPTPVSEKASDTKALTLPVLDAFLANESFSDLLKSRLQLTDEQIAKLKEAARSDTAKLSEANAGMSPGETASARTAAKEKITTIIGAAKAQQLEALIAEQWSSDNESASDKSATQPGSIDGTVPNQVPSDSRVVVNAPAYRMDVFEAGRLIKSYKIGIGYPQFPLPTGLRKARAIIFNPTWTPPDEPWVAKMKNVSAGEKVEVDFFLPRTSRPAPLVVVAHGFSRSRKNFEGTVFVSGLSPHRNGMRIGRFLGSFRCEEVQRFSWPVERGEFHMFSCPGFRRTCQTKLRACRRCSRS